MCKVSCCIFYFNAFVFLIFKLALAVIRPDLKTRHLYKRQSKTHAVPLMATHVNILI